MKLEFHIFVILQYHQDSKICQQVTVSHNYLLSYNIIKSKICKQVTVSHICYLQYYQDSKICQQVLGVHKYMEHFLNLRPQKQHEDACMVQSFHQNISFSLQC